MDFAAAQRIVIVADDDSLRDAMEMLVVLSGAGQSIQSTASGREALRWLDEELCDLLIIDFSLPEMNGAMLYRRVLARWPSGCPRALLVSGDTDVEGYETDPEVLAVPLRFKPFSIGELSAAVTRALTTTQTRRLSIGPRIPLNYRPSHGASGDSGSRNADGLLTS